jgi:hypothetical protein
MRCDSGVRSLTPAHHDASGDAPDLVLAVVGDCHGHLQLALCVLARWQRELGIRFEAVFLCGDVGSFTADAQLDNATRRHGKANPCELEFLHQWSSRPPAPWLGAIFRPEEEGGLGLTCPIIMVHGNHEGFAHLESLVPRRVPVRSVPGDLPAVDSGGHIRFLPPGWRVVLPSGHLAAGLGGIERGQRHAEYHPMAYIDDDAVARLLDGDRVTVLVTHQGPSGVQGPKGSETLQMLLEAGVSRSWFHGHSIPYPDVTLAGPGAGTLVVPLGDIAFPDRGPFLGEPGPDGWAVVRIRENDIKVEKRTPPFLRDFRRKKWLATEGGLLICPPLAGGWGQKQKHQI